MVDIDAPAAGDACLDLFWSSLAVQWCDYPGPFARSRRVFTPGRPSGAGQPGPTPSTNCAAFRRVDGHRHTLAFHRPTKSDGMAVAAGLSAVSVQAHDAEGAMPISSPCCARSKAVGANQVGDGRRTD